MLQSTLPRFFSLRNSLAMRLQCEEDTFVASEVAVTAPVAEDVLVLAAAEEFFGHQRSHICAM